MFFHRDIFRQTSRHVDQIPRSVSSCALESPKMVVLTKGDEFEMAAIKSDNSLIYCQTCDILDHYTSCSDLTTVSS